MTVPTTPPITSALTLDSVSSAERQILARRTSKTVRRGSLRPPSSISMTCGMANSPIRAAMIWTPPSSSSVKMKRSTPWIESEPIMAIHRPIQPASSPLTTDFESSVPMIVTPRIATQNRCEGPNLSAQAASTGVRKISTRMPRTPPIAEEMKQICRARAPAPLRAMMLPSSAVAMLAGAPGMLSRIALTAPPATVEV